MAFILVTSVLVAGLQEMAGNDRGWGVPRSLCVSEVLPLLVVSKAPSERRGKPAGCAKTAGESFFSLKTVGAFGGSLRGV